MDSRPRRRQIDGMLCVRSVWWVPGLLAFTLIGCKREAAPRPRTQPTSVPLPTATPAAVEALHSAVARLNAAMPSVATPPSATPMPSTTPLMGKPFAASLDFPFTVMESAKLRPVPDVAQALILTPEGQIPTRSPLDPIFIVAPSLGFNAIADKKAFAMKRLHEMPGIARVTVTQDDPISIDGLSGFEAIADGQESRTGARMILYQVTLFEKDSHVLLNGMVGADHAPEYLPEFKALARSLQRRRR